MSFNLISKLLRDHLQMTTYSWDVSLADWLTSSELSGNIEQGHLMIINYRMLYWYGLQFIINIILSPLKFRTRQMILELKRSITGVISLINHCQLMMDIREAFN